MGVSLFLISHSLIRRSFMNMIFSDTVNHDPLVGAGGEPALLGGETPHFFYELMNALGLLFLLLLFLVAVLWLFRRVIQNRFRSLNQNSRIQLVEERPISQRTTLYLVEVQGRQIMIAESTAHVKVLTAQGGAIGKEFEVLFSQEKK